MGNQLIRTKSLVIVIILILFTAHLTVILQRCTGKNNQTEKESGNYPYGAQVAKVLPDKEYAGTSTCIECHEKEYRDWLGSDHDESMKKASDKTVKGNFDEITFHNRNISAKFFRKDGKFMVNTRGPNDKFHDYEIVYTFGTEPLQQYIVEFPKGRYQCLRIAWDTNKKAWFDLYPGMKIGVKEWIHWTKGGMNWNTACADCHSTNVHKNYFNKADSFHTTYTIINVSCEACHGPGKRHINFVKSGSYDSTKAYPSTMSHLSMIPENTAHQQVDDCARCHSRRVQFTEAYNHRGTFRDHYAPEILRDHIYFPDGQILEEDYVYSSFIQTKMYHNNVRCTNCHNPHSTRLKFEGNALCLQCHEAKKYNVFEHHFHEDTQGGTQCINCHMDGRYYMVNDYRRDHSFRIPRPDLSLKYGVPNACNSCHTDKDAEWASNWIVKWYGPVRKKNYADVLCLGSTHSEESVPVLDTLIRSKSQPAIARATAVWYLGFIDNEKSNDAILSALNDPDPTVRYTAIEDLQSFPRELRYQFVTPLLNDSVRSVRVMAFDALTDISATRFGKEYHKIYNNVLSEYKEMLDIRADFPGGQLQRARYYERIGEDRKAEEALEKAIALDSLFDAARINLAHLFYNQGKNQQAIDLFKLVNRIEPDYGPAYYSLGLIYAGENRMEEAIDYLDKALNIDKNNQRIYYNLGLAYQKSGDNKAAEATFEEGLQINPDNGDILYALVVLYAQQKQYKMARKYLPRLEKNYSDKNQVNQLENYINQALSED